MQRDGRVWLLPVLAVLLVGSGACALVYQVLWLRLLSLTFGVTTYAASTVLASFMGGLAVGSFVAGRFADRSRHPFRLFGFVELLIGACALATPVALEAIRGLYVGVFTGLPDSLAVATVVRFVLSFAVLLVPTALMGATLPIVLKSAVTRLDGIGSRVGLLYASNTAGAIGGALLAGIYLIPTLGLSRSFMLAASVNALVGLTAIALSLAVQPRGATSADVPGGPAPRPSTASTHASASTVVLAVFALSGFASLALEVIWFRVLVIFLGPTSYAFTVMLAAVLAGIALGSALITPLMRWRLDWLQVLAVMQVAVGLVALQSFSGLGGPIRPSPWLRDWMAFAGLEYLVPLAATSVMAILPTALLFGLAFPVGLALYAGAGATDQNMAARTGVFYSLNVVGGIAGSVVAGFVLLPWLGSRWSLIVLAALFLASGLMVQALIARRRPVFSALAVAAVAVFVVQARAVPDPRDLARTRVFGHRNILWQEEGVQTTVAVTGGPGTGNRTLVLNGAHQANDSPNMAFIHRRIGLLPAVLHPHPRRALIVGLGGGATAGALSQHPGLDLDVVELSPGVMRASDFFRHINFDVLRRPNVHPHVDDGRNFLLRVREPYDVITADAIPPNLAGANSLNSVEYFQLVRNALAPDGVALHWNGGGSGTAHKLILRAFVEVFPNATLWGDGTLMVGSREPMTVSESRIDAMLADPAGRSVLALINVERFDHLVRMFRAGPDDIRAYLGGSAPLTDDKPLLEYSASFAQEPLDLLKIGRTASGVATR